MKALTNGYIYYDPGQFYDFGPRATAELHSHWNGRLPPP